MKPFFFRERVKRHDESSTVMDAQLQKALADIVTALQASAQQVGAAAQEQLPLLVQEYLKWGAFEASRWMVAELWFVGVLVGLLTLLWSFMWIRRHDVDEGLFGAMAGISAFAWLMVFIFAACAYWNYMTVKQIEMAPRVYLVEKIKEIVK